MKVVNDPVATAGVKIVSETAAFWTRVKKASEEEVKSAKNSILLNERIAQLAADELKRCT